MGFGYETCGIIDGEDKNRRTDVIDKREMTSGRGKREKRGGSVIDMTERRGVSVTGLKEKIDASDKRGRREERGKSERTGVRGRTR